MKKNRLRADERVLQLGLVETRSRAQALIMAGCVYLKKTSDQKDWEKVDKAGQAVPPDCEIHVDDPNKKDVGRGAKKLRGALEAWPEIDLTGATCLDIGSSTGGFTQVCLERGAKKVVALDVGTHQLHEKLRADDRVLSVEKQHVLKMSDERWAELDVRPEFDFICTDLSFISATKVIPVAVDWLKPGASWVLLVKPQFELEPKKVPKGIVRNPEHQQEAVDKIKTSIQSVECLKWEALIPSPIKGGEGNVEFLLWVRKV